LSLEFNVTKSQCVVIGKMCKSEIMPMNLNGNDVIWCDTIKYLGVHLQSDRCVKFNNSHTKRNFYVACNSIFLHTCSHGVNDIALLHLQESYSLSVIMYAIPASSLTYRQVKELNVCWNNVIRRVFGYHKWESVSALLLSLERLNVGYLIMLRKVTFYRRFFIVPTLLFVICFCRFYTVITMKNMLKTVFNCRFAAISNVWSEFANYVS